MASYREGGFSLPIPRALDIMDYMKRSAWVVFGIWQLIGIVCGQQVGHPAQWGAQLWAISFLGLLPGNVTAAYIVERSLWMTGVTLRQMSLLEILAAVLINGILWFLIATAYGAIKTSLRLRPRA